MGYKEFNEDRIMFLTCYFTDTKTNELQMVCPSTEIARQRANILAERYKVKTRSEKHYVYIKIE